MVVICKEGALEHRKLDSPAVASHYGKVPPETRFCSYRKITVILTNSHLKMKPVVKVCYQKLFLRWCLHLGELLHE